MIYTITLNPALDKTVEISSFGIGKVNRIERMRLDAGGKGINVSKCLKALGGESIALGFLAGKAGSFIEDYLDAQRIHQDFIWIEGETRTNLKIVDKVCKTNTDINELGPEVDMKHLQLLEDKLKELVREDDIVIFSGSLPKGITADLYGNWIRIVKECGGKAILDADDESLKRGIEAAPFMVKPNIHELERLMDTQLVTEAELKQAGEALLEKGIELMVVSLGSEGALFMNREESYLAEGLKVPVNSTVGAGDSTVAALAYGIHGKFMLEELIRLSIATGAANVMTEGTQAAELESIRALVGHVKYRKI